MVLAFLERWGSPALLLLPLTGHEQRLPDCSMLLQPQNKTNNEALFGIDLCKRD